MVARLTVAALAVALGVAAGSARAFDHAHGAWDALLKRHVVVLEGGKASQVRYAGLAAERAALDDYLDALSGVKQDEFAGWSRPEQMAFLINAYNGFTVAKVLSRYPDLRSIRDFGRVFGNPFKDEFFHLLGRQASLDWIEHERLRKPYRDARIHYALNCASVSCPMLREEAYAPARLERQLDEQAARFLSDRTRNRVAGGALQVSRIFDWYQDDFEPRAAYFARYAGLLSSNPEEKKLVESGRAPLSFLDYDWSLNDARR
jgi:hypothetical protein